MEFGPGIDFNWARMALKQHRNGSFREDGPTPKDVKDALKRRAKKKAAQLSRKRNKR